MAAPRRGDFLFLLLVNLAGSGAAAFAIAFTRLGFSGLLLHEWLRHWGIAFAASLIASMVAAPAIRTIVAAVTR